MSHLAFASSFFKLVRQDKLAARVCVQIKKKLFLHVKSTYDKVKTRTVGNPIEKS